MSNIQRVWLDEEVAAVRAATPETHPHGGLPEVTLAHLRKMQEVEDAKAIAWEPAEAARAAKEAKARRT